MIKKILAVVVAAVWDGAIVGIIPQPDPADAAVTSQAARSQVTGIADSNRPAAIAAVRVPEIGKPLCTQGWPYYEQSCLRDGRRPDGKARVVRVVTPNHSNAGRTPQTRR